LSGTAAAEANHMLGAVGEARSEYQPEDQPVDEDLMELFQKTSFPLT